MNTINLFLLQITLSFGLSVLVIMLLKAQLREVLTEICGTSSRAAFWVTFTQLMLVIAPLLLVILFTDLKPGVSIYPAETIKDTVFRSLFAIFIAIAMIGRVIRKSIAVPPLPNHSAQTVTPALKAD